MTRRTLWTRAAATWLVMLAGSLLYALVDDQVYVDAFARAVLMGAGILAFAWNIADEVNPK